MMLLMVLMLMMMRMMMMKMMKAMAVMVMIMTMSAMTGRLELGVSGWRVQHLDFEVQAMTTMTRGGSAQTRDGVRNVMSGRLRRGGVA